MATSLKSGKVFASINWILGVWLEDKNISGTLNHKIKDKHRIMPFNWIKKLRVVIIDQGKIFTWGKCARFD